MERQWAPKGRGIGWIGQKTKALLLNSGELWGRLSSSCRTHHWSEGPHLDNRSPKIYCGTLYPNGHDRLSDKIRPIVAPEWSMARNGISYLSRLSWGKIISKRVSKAKMGKLGLLAVIFAKRRILPSELRFFKARIREPKFETFNPDLKKILKNEIGWKSLEANLSQSIC